MSGVWPAETSSLQKLVGGLHHLAVQSIQLVGTIERDDRDVFGGLTRPEQQSVELFHGWPLYPLGALRTPQIETI